MAKPTRLGKGITPAASSLSSVKAVQPSASVAMQDDETLRSVGRPRTMQGKQKTFTMRLEADMAQHLNILSATRGTTVKAIFLEALEEWMRARGIAPVVSK